MSEMSVIKEYARAYRVATDLRARNLPLPRDVREILQSGIALYNASPAHVQQALAFHASQAALEIDSEERNSRELQHIAQREVHDRRMDSLYRSTMGGEEFDRKTTEAMSRGERVVPDAKIWFDRNGRRRTSELRKPTFEEQRRATIAVALERSDLGDEFMKTRDGRDIDDIQRGYHRNDSRNALADAWRDAERTVHRDEHAAALEDVVNRYDSQAQSANDTAPSSRTATSSEPTRRDVIASQFHSTSED